MKRLTLKTITGLFILTTIIAPLSAMAQTNPPPANFTGGTISAGNTSGLIGSSNQSSSQTSAAGSSNTIGNIPTNLLGTGNTSVQSGTTGNTSPGATAPAKTTTAPADDSHWYYILDPLTWINTAMEEIVLPVASFILSIAGGLLDFSINFSLHTSDVVGQSSGAIVLGWTIIRDIFNMLFIFILIYSAISIMLGSSNWNGKQMLTKVIIAAILINFSFFITEVIIDAGNIIGGWFYQGIQTTIGTGGSISASISAALGVFSLTNLGSADNWKLLGTALTGGFVNPTGRVIAAFIRLGIIAFTSYIFVYVSVLFLARAISLLFSLVLSPLGFVGGLLPKVKEYADKWRNELIKDILLAPVFLLFLYVIIAFVNSGVFTSTGVISTNLFADPTSALTQAMGQYFKYFLLAGMLLYALRAAKDQSSALGKSMEGMAKQLGQMAAGAAVGIGTGGVAFAARSVIGGGANAFLNEKGLKETAEKGGASGWAARQALRFHDNSGKSGIAGLASRTGLTAAKGLTNRTFDVRGSGAFQGLAAATGLTGKGFGPNLTKPIRTFEAGQKEVQKRREETAKLLGKGETGETRRIEYGKAVQNSLWLKYTHRKDMAKKAGEEISDKAYKGYTKAETEETRKDAQKIKNQIINFTIGKRTLENTLKNFGNNANKLNDVVKDVVAGLEKEKEARLKNNKSAEKEINTINELKTVGGVSTAAGKAVQIQKAIDKINEEVIGKPAKYNKGGEETEKGVGLKGELSKKQRELKQKQAEEKTLLGDEKQKEEKKEEKEIEKKENN